MLTSYRDEILLEAKSVSKRFGSHLVVDHVNLTLRAGQVMTIIGPNGSGKTTLVRMLLGLEMPDDGTIFRRPGLNIGYMPQRLAIDPVLPVSAKWFLGLHSHRHNPDQERIREVCEQLEITHMMETPMQDLSGGELQRLQLARALLCNPEVLVLDEPVQGVDVMGQARLYELIMKVTRKYRLSVLMVSHDLHLVMSSTDEVICLNHHVCCAGHPQEVKNDPTFVKLFGAREAASLAVYSHDHDHEHDQEHMH